MSIERSLDIDPLEIHLLYQQILYDLGYDYEREYDAVKTACLLSRSLSLEEPSILIEGLRRELSGRRGLVIGAGPSIYRLSDKVFERDLGVVVCADGSCGVLRKDYCRERRCVWVGDLDGGLEPLLRVLERGYAFIHFHGDNYMRVAEVSHLLQTYRERIVFTVQTIPLCPSVVIVPGFTDGDRALLLTKALGVSEIEVVGMDLESLYMTRYSKPWIRDLEPMTPSKKRKLEWARRILFSLGLL